MDAAATSRRSQVSWALYDWANSAFATLVVTFVFPAYFAQAVVGDQVRGQSLWGFALGLSGLVIALTSPVLGAVADVRGRRKPWVAGFTALCVVATAALWFVRPDAAYIPLAVVLVVFANWGFEAAGVFYNAMLPDIAGEGRVGRLSGWAWGLGYAGGLTALVVALVGLVMPAEPWFGIPTEAAANVRAAGPFVALWLTLFALPLFLWTPDAARRIPEAGQVRAALSSLWVTLKMVARMGPVGRFLLAHMLYADGLATLFAMGGVYVAGVYGFTLQEVMLFGILLNVTAGIGAAGFAWVDDRVGSKPTILVALAGLLVAGGLILSVQDRDWVWIVGAALGAFVGPAQAASRSYLARVAPVEARTELFGLYALSGKATAFLGPWLVGLVTAASGSQRVGMAVVLVFFLAGALVLKGVSTPPAPSASLRSPG